MVDILSTTAAKLYAKSRLKRLAITEWNWRLCYLRSSKSTIRYVMCHFILVVCIVTTPRVVPCPKCLLLSRLWVTLSLPLGMEVGLGPEHIVLDGDPAPLPKKRAEPPIFGTFLLWPNGCMDQDATWYGGRPRPMWHVLDGDLAPPPKKGAQPLIFGQCPLGTNSWMD